MSGISKEIKRIMDEERRISERSKLSADDGWKEMLQREEEERACALEVFHSLGPREILETLNNNFLQGKGRIIEEENLCFYDSHDISGYDPDGATRTHDQRHTRSSLALLWRGIYFGVKRDSFNENTFKLYGMVKIGIEDGKPFVFFSITEEHPVFEGRMLTCLEKTPGLRRSSKIISHATIVEEGVGKSCETLKEAIAPNFVALTREMEKPIFLGRINRDGMHPLESLFGRVIGY